jgi:hypothetical protein
MCHLNRSAAASISDACAQEWPFNIPCHTFQLTWCGRDTIALYFPIDSNYLLFYDRLYLCTLILCITEIICKKYLRQLKKQFPSGGTLYVFYSVHYTMYSFKCVAGHVWQLDYTRKKTEWNLHVIYTAAQSPGLDLSIFQK